jgi:hypothetical protein
MHHPIYFETFRCNTYNIRLKADEILETLVKTLETIANTYATFR